MRANSTDHCYSASPAGGRVAGRAVAALERSARREVRNPILALPSMAKIAQLSPEARAALVAVLADIAREADGRAEHAWRTRKAPLAAYWRACSVYAGHIKRAVKNPVGFILSGSSSR